MTGLDVDRRSDLSIIRASADLELAPGEAFDQVVEELSYSLARIGIQFDPGQNGRILQGKTEVGRVVSWEPGKQVSLEWHPADWKPDETTRVSLRFEPVTEGTRVTVEHSNWGGLLADRGGDLAGWFASEIVAPFFRATAPNRLGDWITDRRARRPSGELARTGYRDPLYHRPNFGAILNELSLTPNDYMLEIGCGGGALLEEALRSGCRAAAIDHSPEMVKLARELNEVAVKEGRLEILESEADHLPYPEGKFTCATMTNVFGFLPEPVVVLKEIQRVLRPHGKLVFFTSPSSSRGTIASPEPIASRVHFYENGELVELARKAGFKEARVEQPDLESYARKANLPKDVVQAFKGRGGQLTIARKG